MNFKNLQELMAHLMAGGAITNLDDSCKDTWVSFYKGNICFPNVEEPIDLSILNNPSAWRPVPVLWLTENIHRKTNKIIIED